MRSKLKSSLGLGLIGVLLIFGALVVIVGGVLVWQKKTLPLPVPALSGVKVVPPLQKEIGKTWVQINPVQCMANPWQIDWFKTHGIDMTNVPRSWEQLIDEPEEDIIRKYYTKQRVTVHETKLFSFEEEKKFGRSIIWTAPPFCEACICARGDTLYLLISNSDVGEMIGFGYQLAE